MNKKIILGIMIVGIIFGSIGVYAGSNFYANGISVNAPTGSSLGSDATLQSSLDELYSIADKYDELNKKINSLKSDMLDEMYPVGSIYLSTSITTASDVAKKIGGTWEDYGSSDTYLRLGGNGSGGSNSVKISANQIPTHTTGNQSANHTHSGTTSTNGSHVHSSRDRYMMVEGDIHGVGKHIAFTWGAEIKISPAEMNAHMHESGSHNHTFTTGGISANHTHTYTNSNQQNVSITPKYVQVYAFKRTA